MSLGLQTSGTWWDTSYDVPVYETTVTPDIVSQRQDVSTTGSNDQWTDWFKSLAGRAFDYGLQKDAVTTEAELRQPQYTGTYRAPQAQTGGLALNGQTLLLLGGLVVVAMVASK